MPSEYPNAYARLVAERGLDGAKAEMARRRSLVKRPSGGAFKSKRFAKAMSKKAAAARKAKSANSDDTGNHAE